MGSLVCKLTKAASGEDRRGVAATTPQATWTYISLLEMAVAALSPSNTWRWFYRYQVGNDVHTIQCRTPDGSNGEGAAQRIALFLQAIAPAMFQMNTVDFNYSAQGSNVRLPFITSAFAASYGTGVPTGQQSPFGLAFPGRSAQGHKCRVYLIGSKLQGDNNFRYTTTENVDVAAARTVLLNSQPNFFCGIDGQRVNWYLYATSKQNDHFIKKRRGA